MLWQGCYRNPAKKGTFLSSYQGDILMEFRHYQQPRLPSPRKRAIPQAMNRELDKTCFTNQDKLRFGRISMKLQQTTHQQNEKTISRNCSNRCCTSWFGCLGAKRHTRAKSILFSRARLQC